MKTIKGILTTGKYKGRGFIAKNKNCVIILVSKGKFFNGSEMYAKFDRKLDEFIPDNN